MVRTRRHGRLSLEHVVTAASLPAVLQETLENVPTATIVLTSTLVVLEVTSVT